MANGLFNLKQVMQGIQQGGWNGQTPPAVQYLVVAGGGGGGGTSGGGGGAGGLLQGIDPVPNGQTLLVTVGAGGAGGSAQGTAGSASVFGALTSIGGGYGAGSSSSAAIYTGGSGGSGGGGASNGNTASTSGPAGQGTAGQGNAGGANAGSDFASWTVCGGGGGAGTAGLNAVQGTSGRGGNGGAGIASAISGIVTTYAGGGGGGMNAGTGGTGGAGGGGNGTATGNGVAGTVNTGGGGGGGGGGSSVGALGGSGIVILSYPDVYAAPTAVTGGPTVSTSGSGSIAFNGSSQYLNYAAQTPFSMGAGDFTVEFWAYATGGLSNYPSYVDFRGSSSPSPTFYIYNNNGTLAFGARVGGTGSDVITYALSTLNTWFHIAVCRIGTATKMYVNGTQVGSTYTDTNNYTVGTGGPYIGQNGVGGGWWQGYMSNIRIVKGVGVYTGAFTPPTAPLTITQPAGTNIAAITGTQTSLLLPAISGAISADISTNAYAVATVSSGSPTWNASSPFTGTGYKNRVYTWTSSGSITF